MSNVLMATGGYDHVIKIWHAHNGICTRSLAHPASHVNSLIFSHDKKYLGAAGYQHIRIYDLESNSPSHTYHFEGVNKNVTSISFNNETKWLVSGGEDSILRLWDLRSPSTISAHSQTTQSSINSLLLHPNQVDVIFATQTGTVNVWNLLENRLQEPILAQEISFNCVAIDRDATMLAAVDSAGFCFLWNICGGTPSNTNITATLKHKFIAHNKYILKCCFSPCSSLLATCSADKSIKIWKTSDYSLVTSLTDTQQQWVWDCCFNEDSSFVISVSSDSFGRLWSLDNSKVKLQYGGHERACIALAFADETY